MTVYELMERQTALRQASEDTKNAMNTMNRIFNAMTGKCGTGPEKDGLREDTNNVLMALSSARTWLQWCEELLRDVARETEIPWPPSGLENKET